MAIDDRCKLFVAGLPDSISEAVLRELFEATGGTIVDVSVPRDRATGRPRGFGFVTLSSEQEATTARESLDGSVQSGRSISVRAFQAGPPKRAESSGRGDSPPDRGGGGGGGGGGEDRTLYLGNLPYDATSLDVEQMLERAGVSAVVRVNLPLDPQGRPRGFGFVTLGSADDAQLAVDSLRDAEMKGRRVSASIAHARGERPRPGSGPGPGPGPGIGMGGGGGGGFSPRPPPRDAPNWGGDDRSAEPSMPPPAEDGSDDRSGKKTKDKKKRGTRGPERGRTRRDGEGLRSPRARGFYDKDDE